jgi:hypothetical protein
MTRDEIAQMMQDSSGLHWGDEAHFQRFAALVTAAEREACALVAETYEPLCDTCPSGVANAIRARGQA